MVQLFHSGDVNIWVYLLVILFGTGSWVAINGLWVQLPLFVQDLPEGWNLPSYLVIIVQIANLGPILYSVMLKYCGPIRDSVVVYMLVLLGTVSCFLLTFTWWRTTIISGVSHSLSLFILAFFMSIVDCTSSVVFLPYMVRFKSQYLTAFFIGESFSSLLPSMVALAQGAGSTKCQNRTENGTEHLVPVPVAPNFSVSVFCIFLAGMMLLCGFAFLLLDNLTICKREHNENEIESESDSVVDNSTAESIRKMNEPIRANESETESETESSQINDTTPLVGQRSISNTISISQPSVICLLVLTAWLNCMQNGLLPSFQSYAIIPYSEQSYHLAVTLRSIASPIACFIMFLFPTKSRILVVVFMALSTWFMALVTYLAAMSPDPPLGGTMLGQILVVAMTIVDGSLLSSVKVIIASILRDGGRRALFCYGASTQTGSALGALLGFIIVNPLGAFTSKAPCS